MVSYQNAEDYKLFSVTEAQTETDDSLRQAALEEADWQREVNRGTFDPDDDRILFKVADQESLALFEDVQFAHTQTLLEGMKTKLVAVDGENRIEFNEYATEMARRVWASAMASDVLPFYGSTHSAAQLRKLAAEAKKWSDVYIDLGYTPAQVKPLQEMADAFLKLAEQAYGIIYIYEHALPEETHHKLVLEAGEISIKAIEKLRSSPLWKSARFDRLYPNANDRVRAIELAAKLETGQHEFWHTIDDKVKTEFLQIVADDIIDRNTVNGVLTLDPDKFARILKYGSYEAGNAGRTERGRTEAGDYIGDDKPDRASGEGARDRDQEETAAGHGGRTTAAVQPPRTERERKVASFSRILGQEYFY